MSKSYKEDNDDVYGYEIEEYIAQSRYRKSRNKERMKMRQYIQEYGYNTARDDSENEDDYSW